MIAKRTASLAFSRASLNRYGGAGGISPTGRAMATSAAHTAMPSTASGLKYGAMGVNDRNPNTPTAVLRSPLKGTPLQVVSADDKYITFQNGLRVLDTTCGASVSCLGYSNARVKRAMNEQMDKFSYCSSMFFGHPVGEALAAELIQGTGGEMSRAYILCSGSEAMEAAMKMARQYFTEISPVQEKRTNFIGRRGSYHGITIGALSVSGHVARRRHFEEILLPNSRLVSPCNAYRGMKPDQTVEEYVEELAAELDDTFQELGPETVCAFIAEPVVGAALGCVPAVPGYFKAMKRVCDKYGALLILDEVMSGMGRSGTLHAWQQEGVVPDIQTIGKGLSGGYASVAGMLLGPRVADAVVNGTGAFSHGHTYQNHPVGCAAALEVQRIIREDNLVENARITGDLLGKLLHKYLDDHHYVGNVRGKGLFWGIEFVANKETKEPFPPAMGVATAVRLTALLDFGISLYPGIGSKDGVLGDHVLISPAFTHTTDEIEDMCLKVRDSIYQAFENV